MEKFSRRRFLEFSVMSAGALVISSCIGDAKNTEIGQYPIQLRPVSMPQAPEENKPEIKESYYLPLSINIPVLRLQEYILQSNYNKEENIFIVPNESLSSTASEDPENNRAAKNSIYIFGHSLSLEGKRLPFYDLYKMNHDDRILIETKIKGTKNQKVLEFLVKDIVVADTGYTKLLEDKEEPTVILQTSLRTTYNPANNWTGQPIMPMNETLSKATQVLTDVSNKDNYLVLAIVGKLAS